MSDDESSKDSVELFDDGSNNDGAAGDGIYGGYWPVADEKNYNVGIKTVDQITGFTRNGLNWNITDRFTTKGPVKFESLENASNDTEPYPGGRIKYNITLGNNGITDTIKNVNIILIDNEFIKNTTTGTPK